MRPPRELLETYRQPSVNNERGSTLTHIRIDSGESRISKYPRYDQAQSVVFPRESRNGIPAHYVEEQAIEEARHPPMREYNFGDSEREEQNTDRGQERRRTTMKAAAIVGVLILVVVAIVTARLLHGF